MPRSCEQRRSLGCRLQSPSPAPVSVSEHRSPAALHASNSPLACRSYCSLPGTVPPNRASFWAKLIPKVLAQGHPSAAFQPEKTEVDGPSNSEEEARGKAMHCPMDTSKGRPGL